MYKVLTPPKDLLMPNDLVAKVGMKKWGEIQNKAHEVNKRLDELLQSGSVEFDWNGHHMNRKTKPVFPKSYEYSFRRDFGPEENIGDALSYIFFKLQDMRRINLFSRAIAGETEVELNISGYARQYICYECGKELRFSFNGKQIKVIEPCLYPTGYPPFSIELNISSRRIAFANCFNVPEYNMEGYGGPVENFKEMKHYAKYGVCQAYCGNSCPSVYRDGDKFYIANELYDDKDKIIDAPPGEKIGSIGTDLWAWSAMDFKKAGFQSCDFIAEVPAGWYKFTQHFYRSNYQQSNRKAYTLFGTIEKSTN